MEKLLALKNKFMELSINKKLTIGIAIFIVLLICFA